MEDYPMGGDEGFPMPGGGRGRGRGRGGGEPVFSDGFLGGLGGNMGPPEGDGGGGQFDDSSSMFPMGGDDGGMGRGGGRGRGRGDRGRGGRGDGGGRGGGRGGRGGGGGGGGGTDGDFRGPPGLFVKTDWTCTMCGNVNWERRSTCNMCQTAKPNLAGANESRDGIGGGFNERQERGAATLGNEISEDGYDDFGRKIKKQQTDRKAKEAAALARLKATFGATSLSIVTDAPLPTANLATTPRGRRTTAAATLILTTMAASMTMLMGISGGMAASGRAAVVMMAVVVVQPTRMAVETAAGAATVGEEGMTTGVGAVATGGAVMEMTTMEAVAVVGEAETTGVVIGGARVAAGTVTAGATAERKAVVGVGMVVVVVVEAGRGAGVGREGGEEGPGEARGWCGWVSQ